jgi:hypothetical protein
METNKNISDFSIELNLQTTDFTVKQNSVGSLLDNWIKKCSEVEQEDTYHEFDALPGIVFKNLRIINNNIAGNEDLTEITVNLEYESTENIFKPSKGDKIYFKEEKKPYTVRACSKRFLVCTKPFNPKHTVLYTIVDLTLNIRGTENMIFCQGFETDIECEEALERLKTGESEVSHRNQIELNIEKIVSQKNKTK